jgi:hypothetical protein
MKKAFDDVQSSVLPKYNYAVRALETAKKLNRKNNKNIEELEKNLINAKNNLYKKFNNNAFIKNLQKNLEDNSTKIVFRYFKKNEPYYGFLKVLGDYINSKNTNNADNKKLFDFKKVEGSTNNNLLSMLYKKEYSQTPSTYERNSITWKLTSKTNPQNILTQTIGIVTKDLLAKK